MRLKRLPILILIISTLMMWSYAASVSAYKYSVSENIPRDVQDSATEYICLDKSQGGIIGQESNNIPYSSILDRYLQYYGIYAPVEDKKEIAMWLYDELLNSSRIVTIPSIYTSDDDLRSWLMRYADPGDILFYRINGVMDRAVVYTGDGNCVSRRLNEYRILPVPSTFSSDYSRTPSSGLFAIGHIWSEETKERFLFSFITGDTDSPYFSGSHLRLSEYSKEVGRYVLSSRYVLFEQTPNRFVIWDGTDIGCDMSVLESENGVDMQVSFVQENAVPGQISRSYKLRMTYDELSSVYGHVLAIDLFQNQSSNPFQYSGSDLMNSFNGVGE